jgi:hypothetical protein
MEWAQKMGIRRDKDPIVIHIYSEFLQGFRLAAQGKRAGKQPPDTLRKRVETYFDPLPFITCRWKSRHRHRPVPAQRHYAAPDGDVPLLGFAKRLAAPDSHPQLSFSSTRRRLAPKALPTAAGCGWNPNGARCAACADTRKPWSPARSGPGTPSASQRRLEPDARRQRVTARLFAQPSDLARNCQRLRRRVAFQLGPHHRTGRLVRRAGAHLQGRSGRTRTELAAVQGLCPCYPACSRRQHAGRPGLRGEEFANDPACLGHRPERLCRLPRLRDQLQAVEHLGNCGCAGRLESLRRGPERHFLQPGADV